MIEDPGITDQELSVSPRNLRKWVIGVFLLALVFIIVLFYHFFLGPFYFKITPDSEIGGVLFEVKEGMGAKQIGEALSDAGIITSGSLFTVITSILRHEGSGVTGVYLFESPTGVINAEYRISHGKFDLSSVKITFPEGFTVKQIADRLDARLPLFDREKFWSIASTSEGYLFPETYFFVPKKDEREIFSALTLMFREQTKNLMALSSKDKSDIVAMASILEKEVKSSEDRRIVSGILWKRIKIGMALQVDATLDYERNKTSAELTAEDLKEDSPYNTYTRTGLPPSPINNPGLDAIKAALEPKASLYLYFLTDSDNNVHYAKDFEEHKRNKEKYLD
ncbi:MAG TPA: endolytic transglycosylase MltG [Candidatus Paceibacterota bacterium]